MWDARFDREPSICTYVIHSPFPLQDGRLRIGDEIFEVNGVSLVNVSNPLALLRAVLKQVSQVSKKGDGASDPSINSAAGTTCPIIRLLIARRIRHRRSASGHTVSVHSGLFC